MRISSHPDGGMGAVPESVGIRVAQLEGCLRVWWGYMRGQGDGKSSSWTDGGCSVSGLANSLDAIADEKNCVFAAVPACSSHH